MRYEKGHKDITRKRIVDVASKRFRRDGIEAVGVAGLMADAGLTHGGFYAHFGSKEELVREAMADALGGTNARFQRLTRDDEDGLETIVRHYLARKHRDEPEDGCAAASLVSEITRHPKATRRAFQSKLDDLVALIELQLPAGADPDARRRCATGIFAVIMGALQLARAETDESRSRQILDSGIEAALTLGRSLGTT